MHQRTRSLAICLLLALAGTVCAADGVTTRRYQTPNDSVQTRPIEEEALAPASGFLPFAVSLVPDFEIPGETWSVFGLRVNLLLGRHRDVWGVDIGLIGNEVSDNLEGIQVAGLFNRIGRSDGALQLAGLVNRSEGDFYGLQTAGIYNWSEGAIDGAQIALVNRATELHGLQIGLYNAIDHGSGLQIGLINAASSFEGFQIGAFNTIRDSSIPFLPIINFAF